MKKGQAHSTNRQFLADHLWFFYYVANIAFCDIDGISKRALLNFIKGGHDEKVKAV
ncbi:hypothetical protein [Sinanaerobacter chloroacetimidivorans]|uniref:hypothetical protein n=1 Tax=Sinanaerobacter chloroacetimidivorans TaxID=2818044 RepID=UPI001D038F76|nr:hypothetical protein [Sinanaerobacter chloroacetimidivorans]